MIIGMRIDELCLKSGRSRTSRCLSRRDLIAVAGLGVRSVSIALLKP